MVTQARLKELFSYEPSSGLLIRKVSVKSAKAGSAAGNLRNDGYLRVSVDGKCYSVHRMIFLMQTGSIPSKVDHIDGNPLNNKWDNLRGATTSQNGMNRKINSNNVSGVKGVHFNSALAKWKVAVKLDGKIYHGGYFNSLESAKSAMLLLRERLHKNFSRAE